MTKNQLFLMHIYLEFNDWFSLNYLSIIYKLYIKNVISSNKVKHLLFKYDIKIFFNN